MDDCTHERIAIESMYYGQGDRVVCMCLSCGEKLIKIAHIDKNPSRAARYRPVPNDEYVFERIR